MNMEAVRARRSPAKARKQRPRSTEKYGTNNSQTNRDSVTIGKRAVTTLATAAFFGAAATMGALGETGVIAAGLGGLATGTILSSTLPPEQDYEKVFLSVLGGVAGLTLAGLAFIAADTGQTGALMAIGGMASVGGLMGFSASR